MENQQSVTCECCSEAAFEYDSNVTCPSALDGQTKVCQSCGVIGRVVFDDEEGRWIRLYPLNDTDVVCADVSILVEGYEVSQKKLTEMYDKVCELKNLVKILHGLAGISPEGTLAVQAKRSIYGN